MAIYNQTEFAKICGVTRGYLNTYIGREKLIISVDEDGKKFIDDSILDNSIMKEKWIAASKLKAELKKNPLPPKPIAEPEPEPEPEPTIEPEEIPELKTKKQEVPKIKPVKVVSKKSAQKQPVLTQAPPSSSAALDLRKKKAEAEYKETQISKMELEIAKLKGANIPTDVVKIIISSLGRSFQHSYKNGSDALMMELMHSIKADPKTVALYKQKMTDMINVCHRDAVDSSKSKLDAVIADVKSKNKDLKK